MEIFYILFWIVVVFVKTTDKIHQTEHQRPVPGIAYKLYVYIYAYNYKLYTVIYAYNYIHYIIAYN